MSENADEIDRSNESVVDSVYIGQFAKVLEHGGDTSTVQS